VKEVAELLMDSGKETIGNDDYDSSELETEDYDVSQNIQCVTDTDGALLVTQLHFTCTLAVLTCTVQTTVWRAVGTAPSFVMWNISFMFRNYVL